MTKLKSSCRVGIRRSFLGSSRQLEAKPVVLKQNWLLWQMKSRCWTQESTKTQTAFQRRCSKKIPTNDRLLSSTAAFGPESSTTNSSSAFPSSAPVKGERLIAKILFITFNKLQVGQFSSLKSTEKLFCLQSNQEWRFACVLMEQQL